MKDFLAQGQAANTYRPGNEHKILAAIAEKYFGSPVAPNVEELATFLLTDLGSDPLKDKELRAVAYDQLIGIIRDTLEGILDRARSDDVRLLYKAFGEAIVFGKIPLITFNYDLLIDQLLRNTNGWFPIDGYGVRIPLAWPDPQATGLETPEMIRKERLIAGGYAFAALSKSVLLKLHGSLNWGARYVSAPGAEPVELGTAGALPSFGGPVIGPIYKSTHGVSLGQDSVMQHY